MKLAWGEKRKPPGQKKGNDFLRFVQLHLVYWTFHNCKLIKEQQRFPKNNTKEAMQYF